MHHAEEDFKNAEAILPKYLFSNVITNTSTLTWREILQQVAHSAKKQWRQWTNTWAICASGMKNQLHHLAMIYHKSNWCCEPLSWSKNLARLGCACACNSWGTGPAVPTNAALLATYCSFLASEQSCASLLQECKAPCKSDIANDCCKDAGLFRTASRSLHFAQACI